MKISKIFPRDIIALVTLIACFILMVLKINTIVSGVVIMVITFYFSKRLYEELHPNGDLNNRVEKIEKSHTITGKFNQTPKKPQVSPKLPNGQLTSGDFKPKIT